VALTVLGCAGHRPSPSSDPPAAPAAVALGVADARPAAEPWIWRLPPGFPEPLVPADNPMSEAKVLLGRHLFYDRRLSGNGTQSCADCHRRDLAFTDGRARAVGSTGEVHPRGAMSLTNVAYNRSFNWADPTLATLEEQLDVPLFNRQPVELGAAGREAEIERRLRSDAVYADLFRQAFPGLEEPVSMANAKRALAAFERTLLSGRSAYDRLVFDGDRAALTEAAWEGMRLFFSERLGCFECHAGLTFSGPVVHRGSPEAEPAFHNTGLYGIEPDFAYPTGNRGLFEHTGRIADMGRFKAPTLRNIALTAPYMHDGSLATLDEVLDHYAAGGRHLPEGPRAGDGRSSPHKSPLVDGFALGAVERTRLIAFLGSLTDRELLADERFSDPWAAEGSATHPGRR
jgi:cytochrome c peroxidase